MLKFKNKPILEERSVVRGTRTPRVGGNSRKDEDQSEEDY